MINAYTVFGILKICSKLYKLQFKFLIMCLKDIDFRIISRFDSFLINYEHTLQFRYNIASVICFTLLITILICLFHDGLIDLFAPQSK